MTQINPCDPEVYLGALFSGHPQDAVHVVSFAGDPNKNKSWFGGRSGQTKLRPGENWYYSIGLMDPASRGRSLAHLTGHCLITFDDVGTKGDASKLEALRAAGFEPLAINETSPGNTQWNFRLTNTVPEDGGEACQVLAMVRDFFKTDGWGDKGCFDPVRYMRVPGGVNGKDAYANPLDGSPFVVRSVHFDPAARVDLYKLAEHLIGPDFLRLATSGLYLSSRTLTVSGPAGNVGRNASMTDAYVKLAELAGLNPQPSTRAGVIEVDCPNHVLTGAHTNGLPEGFAFINDGMCACHHGHCEHLTSMDFRRQIEELVDAKIALGALPGVASAKEFLANHSFEQSGGSTGDALREELAQIEAAQIEKAEGLDRTRDRVEDQYIYVSEVMGFYDTQTYRMLTAEQFDREPDVLRVWPLGGKAKDRASADVLNRGRMRRVEGVTKIAGQPVIVDEVGPTGTVRACVNIYQGSGIGRRALYPATWVQHIRSLYPDPDDHEYLLDAFAYGIQHPDEPMSIITMLVGDPGTGKDMLLTPIQRIIGLHNCVSVSPDRIMSPFNDWQTSRLVLLPEFTTRNHPGLHEKLRDLTSATSMWTTINRKYARTYEMKPRLWFVGTSNDTDAMQGLQADDRRWAFMYSSAQRIHAPGAASQPFTNLYFDALAQEWATTEFLEGLNDFLLSRQITRFNPNKAPPRTASRAQISEDSLSRAAQWVLDQVTGGAFAGRELLASKELEDAAAQGASVPGYVKNGIGARAIRDGLRAAGYRPLQQIRFGTARVRLWLAPTDATRLAAIESMTVDQLRSAWTDSQATAPNPFSGLETENVVPLVRQTT